MTDIAAEPTTAGAFASAGAATATSSTDSATLPAHQEGDTFDRLPGDRSFRYRTFTENVSGPRGVRLTASDEPPAPFTDFDVTPLSPTIGAEIAGVDLTEPLPEPLHTELHRALLAWKVLFFRDQFLTPAQHKAFAEHWGPLEEQHPFLPTAERGDVVRFEKGPNLGGYENTWHSDVTWRAEPAMGAVLRCIEAPPVGGDTLWADMHAAYELLPADVRRRIDPMVAVHDFTPSFGSAFEPDELARWQERYPAVRHPVVRTHPETGRKLLYVNPIFTVRIEGLEPAESDELLTYLAAQAHIPELQCRFHWTPGAVAFWDNRCTQHYAASDYYPNPRVMERAAIAGDRPY
jgi:taurine dioxygenase